MEIYARQGDLVIEKVKAVSGKLERVKGVTFAGDSSGHPHTLVGAIEMRREGRATLVKVTGKREITHGKEGGHKTVTLTGSPSKPQYYSVRPLRERGDGSDRAVED